MTVRRMSSASTRPALFVMTKMMLALADGKLQQIERRRAIWPRPREIGLIVTEAIADAVSVSVGRVSLDMTERRISDSSAEQMMNELQQRTP